MPNRPVMLVVLDGWGWREETADNAVRQAATPNFDRLWRIGPHALLQTSGANVGLPDGQMGNSEVGHLNIGAGRIVMQGLPRINRAIVDGTLELAPEFQSLVNALRKSGGACHLVGLVSDGGVHSHQDHGVFLARLLSRAGIPVVIHAIMDGRDTAPRSGVDFLALFRRALPSAVSIATVSGRYYAMDRDNRWERVAKAYEAMVDGQGVHFADVASAIDDAYRKDITDEFIVPAVVDGYRGMANGDSLLCFNFRADRVRELLAAILDPEFSGFIRKRHVELVAALGMTSYGADLDARLNTLFPPQTMDNLLGQVVAQAGRTQLRIAETEKYPHVTYFFNGGNEVPNRGEERIMVPSPNVATYDLQPEMSAPELTDRAVAAIASGKFDLIVLNFANADMVGHTGNLAAAVRAVGAVDAELGRVVAAVTAAGGALLIVADHGNCELMRNPETGGPHTAHTTNPVPAILVGGDDLTGGTFLSDGRLADVAPTLLALMGLDQPTDMTGSSLLRAKVG